MKVEDVQNIMKKYGLAWETQDAKLILECFTEDGIYQESPLSKPYKGHKEIKNFWEKIVIKETSRIRFDLKRCYVSKDGETGFAEWECRNIQDFEEHHMVGIMVLKMEGNRISYLNEYWNTKITDQ